jgi:hypothetical protein
VLGVNRAYWREARLSFIAIATMTAFDSAASGCDLTESHPLRMSLTGLRIAKPVLAEHRPAGTTKQNFSPGRPARENGLLTL